MDDVKQVPEVSYSSSDDSTKVTLTVRDEMEYVTFTLETHSTNWRGVQHAAELNIAISDIKALDELSQCLSEMVGHLKARSSGGN